MRHLLTTIFFASLCFLHTGCVTESVSKTSRETRTLLRVLRVFDDAETLELSNGVKVRCAGYRASRKPKIGERPSPEFISALAFIKDLTVGETVWVKYPTGSELKYDTWKIFPAYVWIRRTDLNNMSEYKDVLLNALLLEAGTGTAALEEVPDIEIRETLMAADARAGKNKTR